MSSEVAIGLDLGGTKLAGAVFDAAGDVRIRRTAPIEGRGGGDVGALILEETRHLIEEARETDLEVAGIGVSVPGIYRRSTGTVWAPNIPGWDDYPLLTELTRFVPDVPVEIDNDRAAYILGETWRGSAGGARDAVFLAVGTGIGAGILVDGRLLRGRADIAGSIGWMALERPFQNRWQDGGCFEYQAAGPGLVRVARDYLAEGRFDRSILRNIPTAQLSTVEVLHAAEKGDALAQAVLDNAIELWGMTAANLVSLFNPEVIIFGGGLFGPAARYIERIRTEAERWAQPIAMRQVRIVASQLGGDAGLYGAGALALAAAGQPPL